MKIIFQIAIIIGISAILGFSVNCVRSDGILIYCQWHAESQADAATSDPLRISFEKAADLYKKNEAVFIDARPASEYESGHIKGAINIPWGNAEEMCFKIFQKIPLEKPIVTYCDGPACELSDFLAEFLQDIGYKNAKALHDGWGRWLENGLPQTYPES